MGHHDLQRDLYFSLNFSLRLEQGIIFVTLLFLVFKTDLPSCIFGMTASLKWLYYNFNGIRDKCDNKKTSKRTVKTREKIESLPFLSAPTQKKAAPDSENTQYRNSAVFMTRSSQGRPPRQHAKEIRNKEIQRCKMQVRHRLTGTQQRKMNVVED